MPSSTLEKLTKGVAVFEVAVCFNCNSFIETIALLQENQGDIFPAVASCTVPGTAAKKPNTHTMEINCHESVDVTRVVYSKGSITATY